ncbi:MAG: hypothetical protein KF729_30570 [Sandaracinaceae bacterium]|nr:hypothetical protein [Sandaracinaceae bacterium]
MNGVSSSWTRAAALALTTGALAWGCDGGGDPDDAGTTPGVDGGPGADGGGGVDGGPPTGDAMLRFVPTFGPNAGNQFVGSSWREPISLNVLQPARMELRDHRVVVMLCAPSDATCESPVVVRQAALTDMPIQASFGPTATVTGLPAGSYRVMIFVDSALSRTLGFGWDDGFETRERAWGGVVSELDVMLSAQDVSPSMGQNPPPAPMDVTLVDGEALDLGTLRLQHFHERDLSPSPRAEDAVIAVAVQDGVRVVDLRTHAVEEITAGSGFYTHVMTDAAGAPLAGAVCGMVRGPGRTVFLLYQSTSAGGAGYAVQFDVGARAQLHGGRRILFPGTGTEMPCRGAFHENGGAGYLWVTGAPASRAALPEAEAREGLWFATTAGLASGDVSATRLARGDDPVLEYGVDDLAALGARLFLSVSGRPSDMNLPAPCRTAHCVFEASFDATGRPSLRSGGDYAYVVASAQSAAYPTSMANVECDRGSPWAGIAIGRFHDGRDLLFVGGCLEISIFDLADMRRLDLSPAPGVQGLDATLYGNAFNAFALAPDGRTLWAIPQTSSSIHFYHRRGITEPEMRQTFNRYMAFPIDLSSGAEPALAAAYAGDDLDGHEGMTNIGPYRTPANDPGVDLNYAYYVGYQVRWLPSTAGFTFQSASFPVGPSFVVTQHSLWMRGSGATGQSGLGKGGTLAVYDLASRRAVLWPHGEWDFYPYWAGGPLEDPFLGFDLAPERAGNEVPTRGIAYFAD